LRLIPFCEGLHEEPSSSDVTLFFDDNLELFEAESLSICKLAFVRSRALFDDLDMVSGVDASPNFFWVVCVRREISGVAG
jgi:hypothetical protein